MTSDPLTPLRVLDLALLAIALPIFLFAPIPFLGWVVGAGVWLAWRGIGAWADRKAAASSRKETQLVGWLLAFSVERPVHKSEIRNKRKRAHQQNFSKT